MLRSWRCWLFYAGCLVASAVAQGADETTLSLDSAVERALQLSP